MTRVSPYLVPAAAPQAAPATPEAGPALAPPDPAPLAPSALVRPAGSDHTLPAALLHRELERATRSLATVAAATLPERPHTLAQLYGHLGRVVAMAEAVALSAWDALDPRTGGGVAQPAATFERLAQRALEILRHAGREFDRIEPAFAALVHGDAAWPRQPLAVSADRGDGRALYHYRNTYKRPPGLNEAQRRAEHLERVQRFVGAGGKFEALITAEPGTFATLEPGLRYDYVLLADGTLRLHPNPPGHAGPPKPGHTLLAAGGPQFFAAPVLLAGELWVRHDSAGDVEAVFVANNSGHFKPAFADLANATPHLQRLGIPTGRIVYFGGPNNLASMMAEIGERCTLGDLSALLPPTPEELLAAAHQSANVDLLGVRSWSATSA